MTEPEESMDTGKEEKAVELVSRLGQRVTNLHTAAQTVGREAVLVEKDIRFLLSEITSHLTSLETLLQNLLTRSNNVQKKAPQKKRGSATGRRTRTTKKAK